MNFKSEMQTSADIHLKFIFCIKLNYVKYLKLFSLFGSSWLISCLTQIGKKIKQSKENVFLAKRSIGIKYCDCTLEGKFCLETNSAHAFKR